MQPKILWELYLFLCVLCLHCRSDARQLLTTNLRMTEGSSVDLLCSTNRHDSVEWRYTSPFTHIPRVIYLSGVLSDSERFKLKNQGGDGHYDLTIVNATKNHTGMYECVSEDGVGVTINCYHVTFFKPLQVSVDGLTDRIVGDTFSVACVTDMDESIAFYLRPINQTASHLLYARYSMVSNKNGHITVERIGLRRYQLIVKNVTKGMSGMYECVDDNGDGPGKGNVTIRILRSPASTSTSILTAPGGQSTTEEMSIESGTTVNVHLCIGVAIAVITALVPVVALYIHRKRMREIRDGVTLLAATEDNVAAGEKCARMFLGEKGDVHDFVIDVGKTCGITLLLGTLYFVCRPSEGRIGVCNTTDFSIESYLTLKDLGDEVGGLTSCHIHGCLYVSDWNNKRIHKSNLRLGRNHDDMWWPVDGEPLGLSMSGRSNLLVVCRNQPHDEIVEYTTDGLIMRKVTLQADLIGAVHAMQLYGDMFLVSHSSDKNQRVCLIDAHGNVMISYGEQERETDRALGHPKHIAYDRDGYIFVANGSNNSVIILSLLPAELKYSRKVVTKVELLGPCALWFDGEHNRLYIGDEAGIKVCRLSPTGRTRIAT